MKINIINFDEQNYDILRFFIKNNEFWNLRFFINSNEFEIRTLKDTGFLLMSILFIKTIKSKNMNLKEKKSAYQRKKMCFPKTKTMIPLNIKTICSLKYDYPVANGVFAISTRGFNLQRNFNKFIAVHPIRIYLFTQNQKKACISWVGKNLFLSIWFIE